MLDIYIYTFILFTKSENIYIFTYLHIMPFLHAPFTKILPTKPFPKPDNISKTKYKNITLHSYKHLNISIKNNILISLYNYIYNHYQIRMTIYLYYIVFIYLYLNIPPLIGFMPLCHYPNTPYLCYYNIAYIYPKELRQNAL